MKKKSPFEKLSDELHKRYVLCFGYLKDSKNFIWGAIGIFLFFALVGYFVPLPESFQNEIIDYFKKLILETQNYNGWEMIEFLFTNNSSATFIGLFSGILFGIVPFFHAIINGFILGFAAAISVSENGIFSLWRLFPHGIFEFPAVFISLGLGFKLGSFIFFKNTKEKFKEFFINSLNVYIFVILPLLVIAAILEGLLIVFL
jgi:stage II sporulation protein M